MDVSGHPSLEEFKRRLDEIIVAYQRPEERRIGYGNLRHEYSEYSKDGKTTVNIAVIYETPGGSTTQVNITYDNDEGSFSHLDRDLQTHITTHDPDRVIGAIEEAITEIPRKRTHQLMGQIENWMQMGKGRYEIFGELNKLLQTEFLGGRITTYELKEGIQHVVHEYSKAAS